jgi:hypothetical protein
MKSQAWYDEVNDRKRSRAEALISGDLMPEKPRPFRSHGTKTGRISTKDAHLSVLPRVKGEKTMTTFPTKMSMTLRRFAYAMRFVCVRCNLSKTSKFRAETPDGVVCNGCYGKKLAEAIR